MSDEKRAAVAERAARAGAAVANGRFRTGIDVERKDGKTDVVTAADRDAQDRVVEVIGETFPDEPVVGEEGGAPGTVPVEGPAWIVDPIDGTNNYVRGVPIWATAVAAVRDGEPIAAASVLPALGDTYTAHADGSYLNGAPASVSDRGDPGACSVVPTLWWPPDRRGEYAGACRAIVSRFGDLRRYGSAQAELGMVATGAVDGAITNVDAAAWDTVAGVHLVRQAGGKVTALDGGRWRHDSTGLVASNARIHDELLAAAGDIRGDPSGTAG